VIVFLRRLLRTKNTQFSAFQTNLAALTEPALWRKVVKKLNTVLTNYWIDALIFAGFLVAMEPRLTGTSLHEWISVALAATVIVHLLLHWQWAVSVTTKFFHKLIYATRIQYVVDLLMFVSFTTVIFSGLMISRSVMPFFGIQLGQGFNFRELHAAAASLGLIAMAVHFALHWDWVTRTSKRFILSPLFSRFGHPKSGAPAIETRQN
jgi:hypothetical protein